MAIVHDSKYPDVDIPAVPITEFVLRRADELADRQAIEEVGSGRGYTFGALKQAIHALAGGLQAKGVGPGSTVAIMAPNLPEYAVVFHAVAVAGATNTTINPTYTADEVRHQLQDSEATLLVTIGMFLAMTRRRAPRPSRRCSPIRSSRSRSTRWTTSSCCPTRRARRACPRA
jgi:acyl-CoA synthetase (AMP-forming)/AMP-acid ligase II